MSRNPMGGLIDCVASVMDNLREDLCGGRGEGIDEGGNSVPQQLACERPTSPRTDEADGDRLLDRRFPLMLCWRDGRGNGTGLLFGFALPWLDGQGIALDAVSRNRQSCPAIVIKEGVLAPTIWVSNYRFEITRHEPHISPVSDRIMVSGRVLLDLISHLRLTESFIVSYGATKIVETWEADRFGVDELRELYTS